MRMCIFNNNGNVAKSTFANYVAYPRLGSDAEMIYVEDNNTIRGQVKGAKVYSATPEDFAEMIEYLSTNIVGHNIIVDFGSTESKVVRNLFVDCQGSWDEFDVFVVPHSPDAKQEDTALSLEFLSGLGVPSEKIQLIFTIVPSGKKPEKLFPSLFEYVKEKNNCVVDTHAVIYKTPLFDRIAGTDHTIESILADTTDWQQKIIDAHPEKETKKDEISFYAWMKYNRGLAIMLVKDFDKVFDLVMSKSGFGNTKASAGKSAKKAVSNG